MRSCAGCSKCCYLLAINELEKPPCQLCPHVDSQHNRCRVYGSHPQSCQDFKCMWLLEQLPDEWFPDRCGIVANWWHIGDGETRAEFTVDPNTPDLWKQEPYYSTIKVIALGGLQGLEGAFYLTIVFVNPRVLVVLPDKEVDYGPGTTLQTDECSFEYFKPAEASFDARIAFEVMMDRLPELSHEAAMVRMKRFCERYMHGPSTARREGIDLSAVEKGRIPGLS